MSEYIKPTQIMFSDSDEPDTTQPVATPMYAEHIESLEAVKAQQMQKAQSAQEYAAMMNAQTKPQQEVAPQPIPVQAMNQPVLTQVEASSATTPTLGMIMDLPSGGRFGYPASANYRDILSRDEELLAASTQETYMRVLNSVIKSVMNDCEFYDDLTIADRDFAMLWIWANNYDPVKKTEVDCTKCGNTDKVTVDLTKLKINPPKDKIKGKPFDGTFDLQLKAGPVVTVRLSKVRDEVEAETISKANKDINYESAMIAASISKVNELMDFRMHVEWIKKNVTGREMAIIRSFHEKYNYGVETEIEHTCSSCAEVTHFGVPFSIQDILWPTLESYDFEE